MYILDTDHVSIMQWPDGAEAQRLHARLEAVPAEDIATTIITYEEQTRGWLVFVTRARTAAQEIEAYRRLQQNLDDFHRMNVLEFGEEAVTEYQRLKRLRLKIGAMDLKIAAITLT